MPLGALAFSQTQPEMSRFPERLSGLRPHDLMLAGYNVVSIRHVPRMAQGAHLAVFACVFGTSPPHAASRRANELIATNEGQQIVIAHRPNVALRILGGRVGSTAKSGRAVANPQRAHSNRDLAHKGIVALPARVSQMASATRCQRVASSIFPAGVAVSMEEEATRPNSALSGPHKPSLSSTNSEPERALRRIYLD